MRPREIHCFHLKSSIATATPCTISYLRDKLPSLVWRTMFEQRFYSVCRGDSLRVQWKLGYPEHGEELRNSASPILTPHFDTII